MVWEASARSLEEQLDSAGLSCAVQNCDWSRNKTSRRPKANTGGNLVTSTVAETTPAAMTSTFSSPEESSANAGSRNQTSHDLQVFQECDQVTSTTVAETISGATTSASASVSSTFSSEDAITIHIAKQKNGHRVCDKTAQCKFCGILTTNLRQHLFLRKHGSEPEVFLILSKPKGSKERELLLQKLRNEGNFKHNCEVLSARRGEIIPVRSPSEPVDPKRYIPCQHCFGFFYKPELWRHQNVCPFKPVEWKGKNRSSAGKVLIPCSSFLGKEDNPVQKDYFSYDQLRAVREYFRGHIRDGILPGKAECVCFLRTEESMKGKNWNKVKCTVKNEIKKRTEKKN